ncbi:patatin-like phospholipase family protein [Prosthecodimorpha staleyi]|uniref:Patatin-like phospholipase family protein n=1 Tax=Prosthecodimorpha staleyi TaxID=2840188 RepID=A0A947GC76_9HYPH|nr:patatin-like phospholipase family protein [Prosthecodimorpha staleyi]MBT9289457.1 patatin-like phospholipase family protein [Prosthecodimorpha staleyi]
MSDPRIGLVLGGGGARGFAHIPVIEALDELGLVPAAIAGTSIGAIMGASRGSGLTGREIRERTLEVFGNRAAALGKLWDLRPRRFADILAPGGLALGQLDAERILSVFVGDAIAPTFADLVIPTAIVATDFYASGEIALRSGDLRKAVAASIALPVVFRPVLHDGRVLIDGGVHNPVPVDHVPDGLDFVIAVDVIGQPEPVDGKALPGALETIFGASQILMQAVAKGKFEKRPPDLLIRPAVSGFRVLDFLRAREILEATDATKDEVKRRLERLIAAHPAEPVALPPPKPKAAGRLRRTRAVTTGHEA